MPALATSNLSICSGTATPVVPDLGPMVLLIFGGTTAFIMVFILSSGHFVSKFDLVVPHRNLWRRVNSRGPSS